MDLLQMLRALPDSGADGFRNEHKYICSSAELAELQVRLTALLMPDPHSGADGRYRVRSLYFDTYDDRLVREKGEVADQELQPGPKLRLSGMQDARGRPRPQADLSDPGSASG